MVYNVTEGGYIMLGSVFTFQLPCAIVLCILPASVELVDILLGFALDHWNEKIKSLAILAYTGRE